jgi:hypothetical protein
MEAKIFDAMSPQVASHFFPMSRAWWNVAQQYLSTNIGS